MRTLKKAVKVFLDHNQKLIQKQARTEGYYLGTLVKKGFYKIKRNFDLYGLHWREEERLTEEADLKYEDWLKRLSFLKWSKFIKENALPKKYNKNASDGKDFCYLKTLSVIGHYAITLQRRGLSLLKANLNVNKYL